MSTLDDARVQLIVERCLKVLVNKLSSDLGLIVAEQAKPEPEEEEEPRRRPRPRIARETEPEPALYHVSIHHLPADLGHWNLPLGEQKVAWEANKLHKRFPLWSPGWKPPVNMSLGMAKAAFYYLSCMDSETTMEDLTKEERGLIQSGRTGYMKARDRAYG